MIRISHPTAHYSPSPLWRDRVLSTNCTIGSDAKQTSLGKRCRNRGAPLVVIFNAFDRYTGVQVLQGGECSANIALSRRHYPVQSPSVLRGAVAEPGSDASCEDALHRASVEGLKDPPGDLQLPQLPEVVEALLPLPHRNDSGYSVSAGIPADSVWSSARVMATWRVAGQWQITHSAVGIGRPQRKRSRQTCSTTTSLVSPPGAASTRIMVPIWLGSTRGLHVPFVELLAFPWIPICNLLGEQNCRTGLKDISLSFSSHMTNITYCKYKLCITNRSPVSPLGMGIAHFYWY